jgi:hypothetical protein
MMAAAELLAECSRFGLTVQRQGDKIALEAAAPPPPELLDRLRAAKPALLALLSDKAAGPDEGDFAERAAIVEFNGGIPRAWAEGFARLDCAAPPADVPPGRWRQFIDDAGRFLDEWAATAAALGWEAADLFGCNNLKPYDRIDQAGLLWLLNGDRLISLTDDIAVFETRSSVRQAYRRRPKQPGQALAWDLASL